MKFFRTYFLYVLKQLATLISIHEIGEVTLADINTDIFVVLVGVGQPETTSNSRKMQYLIQAKMSE